MSTDFLPGKFVWFEHESQDIDAAMRFYDGLFGWHSERVAMEGETYPVIQRGDQAIGGYRLSQPNVQPQWISYLSVPDVDASHDAAVAAGSTTLMAPTNYGSVGRACAIKDPTGAPLCLWKGARPDPADVEETPTGGWFWNELWTSDDARALAFYQSSFGFTAESMPMGAMTYYVLKKDGQRRAGLCRTVNPQAKSLWLPYVAVADCDATAEKVAGLGGQLLSAPRDVPGIGRFSLCADPTGAAIAFIRPQST